MEELVFLPPVQAIFHPLLEKHGVQLSLLRLDLIHPYIGGNKWFKLKYNLEEAKAEGLNTLLTFGGAFSNHILATAVAGKLFGFKTIGIIRGEEALPLNPILQIATESGMQLKYITREQYKGKNNPEFIDLLKAEFGNFYLLPEGGANELGVKGCEEILTSVNQPFNVVCCACGTGTTLAGIIRSLKPGQATLGFPVLKGGEFIADEVRKYNKTRTNNWSLQTGYHFGGYAKSTNELEAFIKDFYDQTSIRLDRVYTGKLLYGIFDLISQYHFTFGTQILAVNGGNKAQFY